VTEAGLRVPGILRFPGRAKPGSVIDEPVGGVDLFPTACALAGIEAPKDRVLDGANLLPLLEGKPLARPHPLYWQYDFAISRPWTLALRDGPWKLLADEKLERFALFRMDDDVHEDRDLAAAEPERVAAMAAVLRKLHAEVAAEGAESGNPPARRR
jgi:arylsulfatase A